MATANSGTAVAEMLQMIEGDGTFNAEGLGRFIAQHSLAECRTNYQIAAIMGPQSSGKSTLMNHLVSVICLQLMSVWGARSQFFLHTLGRCLPVNAEL